MGKDFDIKDPRFLRWTVAILVVVVLTPLWLTQTFHPLTYASRQQQIVALERRDSELARELEKARLLVRNLDRVEREYETLHAQWLVASTLLPEQNEMAGLLRQVTAAGTQSGVEFKLFRPEPVIQHEFYTDNPVSVRIQGGYHQTGVFLSRLANLNRIINVDQLRMDGVTSRQGAEQPTFTVETELTLTAYTLSGSAIGDGPSGGARTLASARQGGTQAAAASQ
jgi:type IV pilus assembly protein PilO